jgi:hypothetical protein
MSKPPKLSLASIVAEGAPGVAKSGGDVVQFPPASGATGGKAKGTLKERAKQLSVYLEPAVHDQLRDIAYTERTKIHQLMLEGLDLLFKNRGARSIQQLMQGRPTNPS